MTKFKQMYQEMIKQNKELFEEFEWVHKHYSQNPDKWQRTFNIVGEKVLETVRKYENLLCRKSEGGIYSKFSSNLAEKFQQEVRNHFPKIDYVGIEPEGKS